MTNTPLLTYAYRYGVLTPFLILFEAIGFILLLKKLKLLDIKKLKFILVGYLIVSLTIFTTVFFYIYVNDTKQTNTYGDSLKICLDESDDISLNNTTILCNVQCNQRTLVYLFYYRQGRIKILTTSLTVCLMYLQNLINNYMDIR